MKPPRLLGSVATGLPLEEAVGGNQAAVLGEESAVGALLGNISQVGALAAR